MTTAKLIVLSKAVLLTATLGVLAQSQFQNLGFESERLPDLPPGVSGGLVPITDALPGWSVFLGTNQHSQVYHNALTAGTAAVGVMTPQWNNLIEGAMVS